MNPAQELHRAGQSIWLDSINREMLTEGTLRRYIDELAVTGLTSNPTILGDAMATSTDYNDSLRRHLTSGVRDPQELMNPDYAAAARSRRSQRQNGWHLPARARRLGSPRSREATSLAARAFILSPPPHSQPPGQGSGPAAYIGHRRPQPAARQCGRHEHGHG